MTGYIYNSETRKIVTKILDVQKCNDTTVMGISATAKIGTGEYIVTDQIYNIGDILPEGTTDRRSEIPVLSE
jgi:hypothetical protein